MPTTKISTFDHAAHTASVWLADVGTELRTDDRHLAYRVARAWLHLLRDRLTVEAAAKFGAELPVLLRGVYYDGWVPARVPVKYPADRYPARFAVKADITEADVPAACAAVTRALSRHMSAGQLGEAMMQLPAHLRRVISGVATPDYPTLPTAADEPTPGDNTAEELLDDLHARVETLTAAVHALARGFQERAGGRVDEASRTKAARLAEEILIAGEQSHRAGAVSTDWIAATPETQPYTPIEQSQEYATAVEDEAPLPAALLDHPQPRASFGGRR